MWCNFLKQTKLIRQLNCVSFRTIMSKHVDTCRACVRSVSDEDRMQITFKYPSDEEPGVKKRVYTFDRLKTEELEKTLARITTNVSKQANKKKKKKGSANEVIIEDVAVKLVKEEMEVEGLKANCDAWEEGTCLKIADQCYTVLLNIPSVKSLSLPECLTVGIPVHPRLALEFAKEDKCTFRWYREVKKSNHKKFEKPVKAEADLNEGDNELASASLVDNKSSDEEQQQKVKNICRNVAKLAWIEVHLGDNYTPVEEDMGLLLKVECLPSDGTRNGNIVDFISKAEVMCSPGIFPFEKRQQFTKNLMPLGSFRLVSYNILANCYADSDFARDFLFPYCPPEALSIDYRKQVLLKELQGYNADIICLQEVDKKVFEYDLTPVLNKSGFVGLLKLKTGEVGEGMATFFRRSRFRLVAQYDLSLQQALSEDPMYGDIVERVGKSASLKEKLMERTAVLQVTLLESTDEGEKRHLIVATVHLYFHPRAPHIRTIQTAICLRHIERITEQLSKEGIRPAIIFCGDLNAYPEAGVHEFLTKKRILAKHAEWYAGGKEEFVDGMNLSHGLELVSACGYPRYTNYVTGFAGCLDYIYVEPERLQTLHVVPMPSHEDVTEHTALPNVVFPSDHIALICELAWVGNKPTVSME